MPEIVNAELGLHAPSAGEVITGVGGTGTVTVNARVAGDGSVPLPSIARTLNT